MTDRNAHENEFKAALRRQQEDADEDEKDGVESKMSAMSERLKTLNIIPDEVKMPSDIVRRTAKGQKRRGSVAATQVSLPALLCLLAGSAAADLMVMRRSRWGTRTRMTRSLKIRWQCCPPSALMKS